MDRCPKCGYTGVIRPLFQRVFGVERLLYICPRCGYEESQPCKDAAAAKQEKP